MQATDVLHAEAAELSAWEGKALHDMRLSFVKEPEAAGGAANAVLPLLNVNAGTCARGERHAAKGL